MGKLDSLPPTVARDLALGRSLSGKYRQTALY